MVTSNCVLKKVGGASYVASWPRSVRAATAPPRSAFEKCSLRMRTPATGCSTAAMSPAAQTPGPLVRIPASTGTPPAPAEQPGSQRGGVVEASQGVHAGEPRFDEGKQARRGAGRQQQRVVRQLLPVVQGGDPPTGVEMCHPRPDPQRHPVVGVPGPRV